MNKFMTREKLAMQNASISEGKTKKTHQFIIPLEILLFYKVGRRMLRLIQVSFVILNNFDSLNEISHITSLHTVQYVTQYVTFHCFSLLL